MADIKVRSRLDDSTTKLRNNKFSGRAGLVYVDPTGWAPYVSYSESFIPTATLDPTQKQPFKPETSRQYEAGIRYQPPGTKDSYSAAVFDLRRQNYISYDADAMPRQTGEVTVRGVEFEATLQPVSYTHLSCAAPASHPAARRSPSDEPSVFLGNLGRLFHRCV